MTSKRGKLYELILYACQVACQYSTATGARAYGALKIGMAGVAGARIASAGSLCAQAGMASEANGVSGANCTSGRAEKMLAVETQLFY